MWRETPSIEGGRRGKEHRRGIHQPRRSISDQVGEPARGDRPSKPHPGPGSRRTSCRARSPGSPGPEDHRHRHQRDRRHPRRRSVGTITAPTETILFNQIARAAEVDVRRQVGGGLDPGVGEASPAPPRGAMSTKSGLEKEIELGGQPACGAQTANTPTRITASCRRTSASESSPCGALVGEGCR